MPGKNKKPNKNKASTYEQNGYSPELSNGILNNNADNETDSKSIEHLITREIDVKSLASNDVNVRNQELHKLNLWLTYLDLGIEDFKDIWKGLCLMMKWMSDKPLVQEESTENLGQLLYCFDRNTCASIEFFSAFLQTIREEWFGIDQWRIDNLLMLSTRMLHYMLSVLKKTQWSSEFIKIFNENIECILLDSESISYYGSVGFTMHIMGIFLDELAKVADGAINGQQVAEFIRPYSKFIAQSNDGKLNSHCRERIYYHLLYQSELGRKFSNKFDACQEMGFSTTSINDEIVENPTERETDEADDNERMMNVYIKHLDPRAVNVDVYVPQLPLQPEPILADLQAQLNTTKSLKPRKFLQNLLNLFNKYSLAEFPLGVKNMSRFKLNDEKNTNADVNANKTKNKNNHVKVKKIKHVDGVLGKKLAEKKILKKYKNLKAKELRQGKKLQTDKKKLKTNRKNLKNINELRELLDDCEVEYFIPSRKQKMQTANKNMVHNSLPKKTKDNVVTVVKVETSPPSTPTNIKQSIIASKVSSSSKAKRVKIKLENNTSQDPIDHIIQVIRSPALPYDPTKKPTKGILKANSMPINPSFIKKENIT